MVCRYSFIILRPCEDFNSQFCMCQSVSKTPEKCTVHPFRNKIIDNISIAGKNFQFYLYPDFFRDIAGKRLIAFHLSENILLGDKPEGKSFGFRKIYFGRRGLWLTATGRYK